jgi:hypothetical protein
MINTHFCRFKPGRELKGWVVLRGDRPFVLNGDEEEEFVVIPTRLNWRKRSTALRFVDAVNRRTKKLTGNQCRLFFYPSGSCSSH